LFVPKRAPMQMVHIRDQKTVQLYTNKIMIMEDCKDALPEYLHFVKGVVDTADLPLNVSREVVQASQVMSKIRTNLTAKLLTLFKKWANKEPDKYKNFYQEFGRFLKIGHNSDFTNREKLTELLRFESSQKEGGELTSLKDYTLRMKESQKDIYYMTGETREAIEKNPNMEYFRKHDLEVLILTDPIDPFVITSMNEYDKKQLVSIDKADIDLDDKKIETPETEEKNKLSQSLLGEFKTILGDKVEDVVISKRLVDSPATLVVGKEGLDRQMEKVMKAMGQAVPPSKKVLEVNIDHPIVRNLSRMYLADANNEIIQTSIQQLFEGAVLIDQEQPPSSEFMRRMFKLMEQATK
ncbi:MAG: molecular chaperone HtpG, partial [Candidatus Omnitrophica bacterium]|nr:molecular chaperone HtpG [Candidatus Omnitrophota bacterium]